MEPKYRIVVRYIPRWFRKPKKILVIQRRGRGMTYPGIIEDFWYDCTDEDYLDVFFDLFWGKAYPPKNP